MMVHAGLSLCVWKSGSFTRESKPVVVRLEGLVPLGPQQQETGEETTATCCGRAGGQQRGLALLVGRNVSLPKELFSLTLSSINSVVSKSKVQC